MKVVFLAPHYPPEMQQFTRGLAEVGATVYGVGDQPREALSPGLKRYLSDYLHVAHMTHEEHVMARVHEWLKGRQIDTILANWEPLMMCAARLRERFGMPGMSVDAVRGFRDKQLMKERVAAAGLRVPHSFRVRSVAEVHAAAERIGYPLVLKPISGAGSADTYKIDDRAALDRTLPAMRHVHEAIVEEYIDGEEFTFDTVSLNGTPQFTNVAQYLPKPIIARSEEWVSPVIITVRDLEQPKLAPGLALGRGVLKALGMGSGFTHMEWFLKPDGEAVFGEVGCRAPGAKLVDQMNYTCDIDLYREWARVMVHGRFDASGQPSSAGPSGIDAKVDYRHNTAIIFKRAKGHGRITRIEGLNEFMARHGKHVVEQQLLPVGAHRRDWKQTLISDGHIMLRHPEWQTAYDLAFEVAKNVHLYAQ